MNFTNIENFVRKVSVLVFKWFLLNIHLVKNLKHSCIHCSFLFYVLSQSPIRNRLILLVSAIHSFGIVDHIIQYSFNLNTNIARKKRDLRVKVFHT